MSKPKVTREQIEEIARKIYEANCASAYGRDWAKRAGYNPAPWGSRRVDGKINDTEKSYIVAATVAARALGFVVSP